MRVVLDTSVIISAVRSAAGSSKELIHAAFDREFSWLLSNPLYLEYEAVLSRPEHTRVSKMSELDIANFLDAVAIACDFERIVGGGGRHHQAS